MSKNKIIVISLAVFLVLCGVLAIHSGVFKPCSARCTLLAQTNAQENGTQEPNGRIEQNGEGQEAEQADVSQVPQLRAIEETVKLTLEAGEPDTVMLGSTDKDSGFKYEMVLNTNGASIESATFSEYGQSGNKEIPLTILSHQMGLMSMENDIVLTIDGRDMLVPISNLAWKIADVSKSGDTQSVTFSALVKNNGQPFVNVTKQFTIRQDDYLADCVINVENLSDSEQTIGLRLVGPVGIGREDIRTDMRKVVHAYRNAEGQISSSVLAITDKKFNHNATRSSVKLENDGDFIWAAVANKYFAAIVVPVSEGNEPVSWLQEKYAVLLNPDGVKSSDDENLTLTMRGRALAVSSTGQQSYGFKLFIGPKDKPVFDSSEYFTSMGFFHTIDFSGCCVCPSSVISPLSFGILALMKWMYGFIPNYGIVIIIFVLLIRLIIHPLTKKSQVSMHRMGKLGPKAEEIKKKHGANKQEMNRQLMELYREQGMSPIMGMLPMFAQMPIWIALYGAINASIALRGEPFLPFWITDLSAQDAIIRWAPVTIPIVGWKVASLNLLPILMGVAFYFQQKMMPQQAAATANPQMAQQQKMMKIMMPVLFPIMLYNAPSGLNLYIMASVFGGVLEQKVIRKHIEEREAEESKGMVKATRQAGAKTKKKKPKPFFRS